MRQRISRRTLLWGAGLAALGVSGGVASRVMRGASPTSPAVPAAGFATLRSTPTAIANRDAATDAINGIFVVKDVPLDPVANQGYASQDLAGFYYSRLFRFDSGPDPLTSLSRSPVPDLVASYELVDPITNTMRLRGDALFHPPLNRPATAADVLASFQRFTTEAKNLNNLVFAPYVNSLTAPTDNTVQFKLKQPYAPFLSKLANPQYLWVLPKEISAGSVDPSKQPVGTGPWIWQGTDGATYRFAKNPSYFVAGLPRAAAVSLNIVPQTSGQKVLFQGGGLDVLGLAAADAEAFQQSVPKATATAYFGNLLAFLFFSDVTTDPIFRDDRVRRAVSLAIDRDSLITALYGGHGAWSNLINPGLGPWWLDPQSAAAGDSGTAFKRDLTAARQLLAAANYDGQQITLLYPNDAYGPIFNTMAEAIPGMLADAGFKVGVQAISYLKDYISTNGIFTKGAPPSAVVVALQTPFVDADEYVFNMLHPLGNRNHSHVKDAQLSQLIATEQREFDVQARMKDVQQIEQVHAASMYYVPLVCGMTYVFTQPWVQNYVVADNYGFGTESYAYISIGNH